MDRRQVSFALLSTFFARFQKLARHPSAQLHIYLAEYTSLTVHSPDGKLEVEIPVKALWDELIR